MPSPKSQVGKVEILVQSDRLQLRWSWIKSSGGDGRRYVLPLGLSTPVIEKWLRRKPKSLSRI